MHYKVLKGLLIVTSICCCCDAIGIDGKLDFGDSHSSHPSLRNQEIDVKNPFLSRKYTNTMIKAMDTSDDFDNIGVVCTLTGCNSTKTVIRGEGDNIQTDVVVHVSTKVDLDHNKSKPVEDTPDIPIVVGYKGTSLDTTVEEENPDPLNPSPIIVTDFDEMPAVPLYNRYPSTGTYNPAVNTLFRPSVNDRVDSSVSGGYNNYNPPMQTDSFYYSQSSGKNEPTVNINIKTLPPITVSMSDIENGNVGNDVYKTNGIDLNVPYFQPSFHNHYFGEQPPPQVSWYPKMSNSVNPVEFKPVKSTWTPSIWNQQISPHRHTSTIGGTSVQRIPQHRHTSTTVGTAVKCACNEGHMTPGLRWYPNMNRRGSFDMNSGDPGSQINDKLAPLN